MELISKEELIKELKGSVLMMKDIPTWPPTYEDTNIFHIIDKIPVIEVDEDVMPPCAWGNSCAYYTSE